MDTNDSLVKDMYKEVSKCIEVHGYHETACGGNNDCVKFTMMNREIRRTAQITVHRVTSGLFVKVYIDYALVHRSFTDTSEDGNKRMLKAIYYAIAFNSVLALEPTYKGVR